MFVLADAFTASARAKIEAAGGTLQSLTPGEAATRRAGGDRDAADPPTHLRPTPAGDPTELDGGSADTATRD